MNGIRQMLSTDQNKEKLKATLCEIIQNELTEVQRYTLEQVYFHNKCPAQIARDLGVQRSTVSRTLKSAEAKIFRILRYL